MHLVQGPSRGISWTAHKLPVEEPEKLQAYFTKVLEILEADLEDGHQEWLGLAGLVRILDRRVSTKWMMNEVRSKFNLEYNLEVIPFWLKITL